MAFCNNCTCNQDNSGNQENSKRDFLRKGLIAVDKSQVANFKPHISEEDVRKGIPGEKFVMVIDLSKCKGVSICTDAYNKIFYLLFNKKYISDTLNNYSF